MARTWVRSRMGAGSERDGVMDSGMCGQDEMDDGGNKRHERTTLFCRPRREEGVEHTHHGNPPLPSTHTRPYHRRQCMHPCIHATVHSNVPTTYNHASARPPLPPSSLATHPGPEPNTPLAGSPLSGARARPGRLFSLAVTSSRRDTGQRQTPPERPKPQAQSDHTVAHLLASAGRHTLLGVPWHACPRMFQDIVGHRRLLRGKPVNRRGVFHDGVFFLALCLA